MDLKLVPHVGVRESDGVEFTHAQDQIFLGEHRIGYVGHEPGSQINLILPLQRICNSKTGFKPKEFTEALDKLISGARGGVSPGGKHFAPELEPEESGGGE